MNAVQIGSLKPLLVWNQMWWDLFAHQLPTAHWLFIFCLVVAVLTVTIRFEQFGTLSSYAQVFF